jgi:hypothetical protein
MVIFNEVDPISMLSEVEVYYLFYPSFFSHWSTLHILRSLLKVSQIQCSGIHWKGKFRQQLLYITRFSKILELRKWRLL